MNAREYAGALAIGFSIPVIAYFILGIREDHLMVEQMKERVVATRVLMENVLYKYGKVTEECVNGFLIAAVYDAELNISYKRQYRDDSNSPVKCK